MSASAQEVEAVTALKVAPQPPTESSAATVAMSFRMGAQSNFQAWQTPIFAADLGYPRWKLRSGSYCASSAMEAATERIAPSRRSPGLSFARLRPTDRPERDHGDGPRSLALVLSERLRGPSPWSRSG